MKEHWISKRLTEIGRKKNDLAMHLKVAPPRISEIIRGDREVQADEIPKLAKFLRMTVEEVVSSLHGNLRGAPRVKTYLKGTAQAGHWMVSEHWPEDEWEPISLPIPAAYKDMEPFWLRVVGDSMDEVYPDATLILCVPCRLLNRELRDGERVVAQRRDDNDQYEITVKEYRVDGAKKWLVAKSTNPEFAGVIPMLKKGTQELEVVALVIAHFRIDAK